MAYPWAMAAFHLTPFDKGLVYAICIFTIPLYGLGGMRLLSLQEPKLAQYRRYSLCAATVLAIAAITNPWHGQFALFDQPVPGQPNHLLDYQTPYLGAYLTLLFAGVVVVGTAFLATLRLLRSRFVLSNSVLSVLLPVAALMAYFNSSLWNLFAQLEINPYFCITTLTLYYFSYLSLRGKITPTLPPAHTKIISMMPDAVVIIDGAGTVVDCNPAFENLVGESNSSILQQPLSSLLPDSDFLTDDAVERCMVGLNTPSGVQHLDLHIRQLSPTGSVNTEKMILMRDATDQTSAYQRLQESEQKLHNANAELAWLSTTDSLTGLRNRRYFQQQLEQELERYSRKGNTFGLLSLDLDHFKNINDNHGHQAGDSVLTHVARALEQQCRATDTLARIGGEEFMVLLVDCDQRQLLRTAERLRMAVAAKVVDLETTDRLSITASVGATLVQQGDSMRQILNRADGLLYRAKREGRNMSIAL